MCVCAYICIHIYIYMCVCANIVYLSHTHACKHIFVVTYAM